ncbi:MAG: type II toxin-antitoxin system VapC family toxin [bacterium]|nr:type II toxin-antitoxin system VapC family toxin [bacterium]
MCTIDRLTIERSLVSRSNRYVSFDFHTVNSFALEYENRNNPKPEHQMIVADLLHEASEFVSKSESIVHRANELEQAGVMAMDALHVACAEHIGAEYFVTCDDTLFKKLNRLESTKMQAVTVMDFMSKEVFQL